MTPDTTVAPPEHLVWIVLIALFNLGANAATIVLALATFRKQRTEITLAPHYVNQAELAAQLAAAQKDSADQWREINQLKKDVSQIPDRLFSLLANAGVIERKNHGTHH